MLTLFLVFGLMPVLIFIELTVEQWLFKPGAEKIDAEWELYRQRYDEPRSRPALATKRLAETIR